MTRSRGLRVPKGTRQKWLAENEGRHFCRCGCGQPIPLRAEHFNAGVPQFVLGHNAKVDPPRKPKFKPVLACKCGCGAMAGPGKQYVSGHNARGRTRSEETRQKLREQKLGPRNPQHGQLGTASPSWKGGVQRHGDGYILEYCPGHPFAVKRYVLQHRLIAERHLRATDPASPFLTNIDGELYLQPDRVDVHHINEDKADNRLENLQVMWRADHFAHHRPALDAAWRRSRGLA